MNPRLNSELEDLIDRFFVFLVTSYVLLASFHISFAGIDKESSDDGIGG